MTLKFITRFRSFFDNSDESTQALAPTDIPLWLDEARAHHQARRLSAAEQLYRRILEADPNHADALHLLGLLAYQAGQPARALDLIGQALTHRDDLAAAHNDTGTILRSLGRLEEAQAAFLRSLQLDPDCGPAWFNLGALAVGNRGAIDAESCFRRAVCLLPDTEAPYFSLGMLQAEAARFPEAGATLTHGVTIRPDRPEVHVNLGNVLRKLGRPEEAARHYAVALQARPESTEGMLNLASIERYQGHYVQAEALLRRALALRPDYAEAHNNLGVVLHNMGCNDDALRSLQRCLVLIPDYLPASWGKLFFALPIIPRNAEHARQALINFDQGLTEWRNTVLQPTVRQTAAEQIGDAKPFYLIYRPGNHIERLSRYGDVICDLAASRWPASPVIHSPRDDQRLRLAIVNHHVRHHSVWDMVLHGFLAELDRDRFHVTLIHTDPRTDAHTETAQSLAEIFHGSGIGFSRALKILQEEPPDILFYPEIGMDRVVCKLAALRLAPLQVTSWGHPTTSGLRTMDLFFSGTLLEAPDAQSHYREKLILLPGTGVVTYPIKTSAIATEHASVSSDGVVNFVLCQNFYKVSPDDDDLFAQIIEAAAPCRLWVVCKPGMAWNDLYMNRLRSALRRRQLDPDLLLNVVPWMPNSAFLDFLMTMDIYLDGTAFSGYTTARQATHCGLPIVTLEGPTLRQRLAAGFLRQIGQTETIVSSPDHYIALAARLAAECRDPERRAARRQALSAAAPRGDLNRAAVRAFERTLVEELDRRRRSI